MLIGILLIILSIMNVLLFVIAIASLFINYSYFIAIIVVCIMLYLVIATIFYEYTRNTLNKEKDNLLLFNSSKFFSKRKQIKVIEFFKVHNKWICNQDEKIEFALSRYLFKKSFILASVIRAVRYTTVSNHQNLIRLFNFRLKINNIESFIVRFVDGNKVKEYQIVKEYISRNTMLSRAVTKSKYYKDYLGRYSYKDLKMVQKIDESIYLR